MSASGTREPATRTARTQLATLRASTTAVCAICTRLGKSWPTWAAARYVPQKGSDRSFQGDCPHLEKLEIAELRVQNLLLFVVVVLSLYFKQET